MTTGARIGRFVVLGMVGKGGMGEVYAAFDPDLDRKVAVKLLRTENAAGVDPSEGRARMLREAQAIAKLSDPNVVTVYDVGTFEGRVFLAMEFVDGNTLTYWLHAQPRRWREVLDCYRAAGRGLASAHRASIVHRDFKPDNVMVSLDGSVRVMDFGLARTVIEAGPAAGAGGAAPATGRGVESLGASVVRRSSAIRTVVSRPESAPGDSSGKIGLRSGQPSASAGDFSPVRRTPAGVVMVSSTSLFSSSSSPAPPSAAPSASASASTGAASLPRSDPAGPDPKGIGSGVEPAADPLDGSTRDLAKPYAVTLPPGMSLPVSSQQLTETGAMMGTPAYMAPEQFQGKTADGRTDQFSFCVALYEAIYGQRPFAGRTLDEITRAVLAGAVRPAPPHTKVPSWVRRVLLRGLRVDREQRYPSMEELLAALGRDPAQARRRWAAFAAVTALVGGLSVGLVRAEQRQKQRCLGASARLAGIWELPQPNGRLTARKEAVRAAFMATGKRYAADSFMMAMNTLDRYVSAWNDMHREACEATNVRGEQSSEVLDLRMMCLQDRFSEVRALTSIFTHADGEVVSRAVQATEGLRPIEPCADVALLKAVVRPPEDPAVRRAVADVRAQLAGVKALMGAGQYRQGRAEAATALAAAERTGYAPVKAEANLYTGELAQWSGGDSTRVEQSLEQAVWLAESSRHDEVALEASAQLIAEVGFTQRRFVDGERWGRLSEAILARVGAGHEVLQSWRLNNLSLIYYGQGRLADALAVARQSKELKIQALGPVQVDVAISELNVAVILHEMGRTDDALKENQLAMAVIAKVVGVEHPLCALVLENSAEMLQSKNRFSESRALAESAQRIIEREQSHDSLALATTLSTIGQDWLGDGDATRALPPLERAISICDAHPEMQDALFLGYFALAKALFEVHRDPARSLRLAKIASDHASKKLRNQKEKQVIDAWIEEHTVLPRSLSMR